MLPAYHPNAAHLLLSPLQRSTSFPLIFVPNTTHLPLQSTTPIDYHPPTAIHLPLHLLLPPPLQSTYLSLICYLLPPNSPAVSTTINHLLPTYCCFQYHHTTPTTTYHLPTTYCHTHAAIHLPPKCLPPTCVHITTNLLLSSLPNTYHYNQPYLPHTYCHPPSTAIHLPPPIYQHHHHNRHSKYSYQLIVEHRRWGRSGVGKAPVYLSNG